ncbi:Peptidoglycan glycosyltransferase [Candidatus Hydrogenisulfobacillus filiaventi]|uniref:Penicillin-binding protein 1A n=1 Tax=Candidatus Hydrogenisulfobacillus filiaventi TaxID=2707344 RepID=A0A6F8ZI66_9FIRM|nr:Peptidoglycan glycosyltransferase [Candidatus Hydrogenisulfobacillus filiaventi]
MGTPDAAAPRPPFRRPWPAARRRRWRRWMQAGFAAGLAVSLWSLAGFYRAAWPGLTTLPHQVRAGLARHGARFVPLSRISPWLPEALITTEDRTFYANWGVSVEGTLRSLVVDLRHQAYRQGGSTITQQLVRDTLLTPTKTFRRKLTEALLAPAVTLLYSKRTILALYLNRVYYGDGAYGVGMAARRYFGEPPARLTLPQASLLAGLLQAPSYLDPYLHPAAARARQRVVLTSMVQAGMITPAEAAAAAAAPWGLRPRG